MGGITSLLEELPSGYSRLTHFVVICPVNFCHLYHVTLSNLITVQEKEENRPAET